MCPKSIYSIKIKTYNFLLVEWQQQWKSRWWKRWKMWMKIPNKQTNCWVNKIQWTNKIYFIFFMFVAERSKTIIYSSVWWLCISLYYQDNQDSPEINFDLSLCKIDAKFIKSDFFLLYLFNFCLHSMGIKLRHLVIWIYAHKD